MGAMLRPILGQRFFQCVGCGLQLDEADGAGTAFQGMGELPRRLQVILGKCRAYLCDDVAVAITI